MASASDKARFYLEQSVPELQELERKKIFTKEEISSIARKRSDFEHTLNGRGSRPSDYARYAEFEINLDSLRRKRTRRLGIKSSNHAGQRRIFFILDRAVRKFHGDLGLWMQYIEFARKEKASKKLAQIFTQVLRLMPTKPELWIYAARYFLDSEGDITNARSYMQRGLRFCKVSKLLWLEYAKLEMIYIAKLAGRRKVLGLDEERPKRTNTITEDDETGMISLPEITAEDVNPTMLAKDDAVDEVALQNLASAPVLKGAIPIAIFDAAMKQMKDNLGLAEDFFNMFAEFDRVPCLQAVLQHVFGHLSSVAPGTIETLACQFRSPTVGIEPTSPEFASAISQSLTYIQSSFDSSEQNKPELSKKAILWILPYLLVDGLDSNIKKVLSATLRNFCRVLEESHKTDSHIPGNCIADVIDGLIKANKLEDARSLVVIGLKNWKTNERLLEAEAALSS